MAIQQTQETQHKNQPRDAEGTRGRPRIFLKDICRKHIYFIGSRQHGIVKIGVSICPSRRVGEISLKKGIPMDLLGTEPGGYAEERQLHERFAKYALGNEYFTLSPEIDEYASGLIDMVSRYYAEREALSGGVA